MTSQAGLSRWLGARGGQTALKFAPGDAWGGGIGGLVLETRPHLPLSLLLSASISLLQCLFLLLLAGCEALSLDKKLDR